MRRNLLVLGIFALACAMDLSAQSFSFYSTMRAGLPGGGDWEMGVGSTPTQSNATWSTRDFFYNSSPSDNHWRAGGLSQNFRIGYDAATNSAYATVYTAPTVLNPGGVATTVTRLNPGAALTTNTLWTLPAGSFLVSASGRDTNPSSIILAGLSLGPNVSLISGSLPSGLGVSESGTGGSASIPTPIVIDATANGGSWYIAGNISFSGLQGSGGSSRRSELQFNLQATGSQAPEATTLSLLGGGLLLLGIFGRAKRTGIAK